MTGNTPSMRRPRRALLSAALLATSALALPLALPTSAAPAHTTAHGCLSSVPEPGTSDAVKICYSVHKPATASAGNRVPVVLHSHGWGGSRTRDAGAFKAWLDAGFGVVSFDQRGFGESGGKAHVEDPAFEGQDVKRVVDLVAAQPWVKLQRKGDPVLGAIGGSYGGGYQFVGAFTELMERGRTRFDALAPEITWYDLNESLAPQGVVRTAWVAALYAAGAEAHTTTVHHGFAYGAATGDWPTGQNPAAPDMQGFFADNGPAFHVSKGRRLDIPVLFGQGATDNLFPLDQGLKNFDRALTPRARARSIFVGYNGGHALPSVVPPGMGTAGDPCSKRLGGGSFGDLARRFMTENLLGRPTGLRGHGAYHLANAEATHCFTTRSVKGTWEVPLADTVTTVGAGAPVAYPLVKGPITIAGTPRLRALVTAAGVEAKAFFALAVGTTPADAKVVQNNTLPLREPLPVQGAERDVELPSVAVHVPAGKQLFVTVSPVADMYAAHGSRVPGAMLLRDVRVTLPLLR